MYSDQDNENHINYRQEIWSKTGGKSTTQQSYGMVFVEWWHECDWEGPELTCSRGTMRPIIIWASPSSKSSPTEREHNTVL